MCMESLGAYPAVPYTVQRTVEDLKKGAKAIRMIHDDLDDAEEFKGAKQLVSSASNILFLGFGYDKRTLRRLGVLEANESSQVYGTARVYALIRWRKLTKCLKGGSHLIAGVPLSLHISQDSMKQGISVNEQRILPNRLLAEVDITKHPQAETAAEIDALLPSILDKAFKAEL